jgi:flagellar hook-associated protein 3 FlgL
MTRIATLAQNTLMLANLAEAQARVAETQISISNGRVAERYSEIAPDSRRLVSLKSSELRTTQYVASNKLADQRLQAMETSVTGIMQIAQDLRTELVTALNANGKGQGAVSTRASGKLAQIANLLNANIDGRYLFSGSTIDRMPVDLTDPAFTAPPQTYPSVADTTYYQGDQAVASTQADDSVVINYGITADDPAFEKVIRALNLTGTASSNNDLDPLRGNEALRLIDQAVSDLGGVIGRVGASRNNLEAVTNKHSDYLVYVDQSISDIEATDIPSAMSHLSQDTAVLQASYAVLAQIKNLSLANYLK